MHVLLHEDEKNETEELCALFSCFKIELVWIFSVVFVIIDRVRLVSV